MVYMLCTAIAMPLLLSILIYHHELATQEAGNFFCSSIRKYLLSPLYYYGKTRIAHNKLLLPIDLAISTVRFQFIFSTTELSEIYFTCLEFVCITR